MIWKVTREHEKDSFRDVWPAGDSRQNGLVVCAQSGIRGFPAFTYLASRRIRWVRNPTVNFLALDDFTSTAVVVDRLASCKQPHPWRDGAGRFYHFFLLPLSNSGARFLSTHERMELPRRYFVNSTPIANSELSKDLAPRGSNSSLWAMFWFYILYLRMIDL